jgi:hypothetical protein
MMQLDEGQGGVWTWACNRPPLLIRPGHCSAGEGGVRNVECGMCRRDWGWSARARDRRSVGSVRVALIQDRGLVVEAGRETRGCCDDGMM